MLLVRIAGRRGNQELRHLEDRSGDGSSLTLRLEGVPLEADSCEEKTTGGCAGVSGATWKQASSANRGHGDDDDEIASGWSLALPEGAPQGALSVQEIF